METKNQNRQPTPIDKLHADKAQLKRIIKTSEQNLGKEFLYLRDNFSSLMISGFISMLSSSGKSKKEKEPLGKVLKPSDYLSLGKEMLPIVWKIAQPFVLTWSINIAKNLMSGIFTRKRKKPTFSR
jgi:hypothetical protein